METFQTQIAYNKRRTAYLVVCFWLLALLLGAVFFPAVAGSSSPKLIFAGMLVATAVSVGSIMYSYFHGQALIISIAGANELQPEQDRELQNVLEEMAIAAGIPKPGIYLIEDSAMNAFATGRDPEHAIVAITTGLRQKLSRDELQAVIAHEIGHIQNYDIRLTMMLAVLAGGIVLMSDSFWRSLRKSTRRSSSRRHTSGAAQIVIVLLAIVLALAAPLIARLLQLAVSREREYLADATAVKLTRNPEALVSALRKLVSDTEVLESANRATEHLYIVSPTRKLSEAYKDSLWSTHPPLNLRISRIRALLK